MTDLAESLVECGVEVTALSGRGRYNGGERLSAAEEYKGVRIERAWSTSRGKGSGFSRLSDYLSFYFGASWKLMRLPRHDVVMALTTPPLIGLIAVTIGRARRMRVVSLVQDVYPDVAVALGTIRKGNPATRLLDALGRYLLRKSDRIVVLGECMRERIIAKMERRIPSRHSIIRTVSSSSSFRGTSVGSTSSPQYSRPRVCCATVTTSCFSSSGRGTRLPR
jgi:colanic acid biosynthesis glycosyl transferase WcaI